MHHWEVGGPITIGWPDQGVPARTYEIVELELLGQVFRGRVTDGSRQGGFLVIFNTPEVVLEQLAEQATHVTGFKVIVSGLRCTVDGVPLRSFDYEWYPTPGTQPRNMPSVPPCWPVLWPNSWKKCRAALIPEPGPKACANSAKTSLEDVSQVPSPRINSLPLAGRGDLA